MGAATAAAVSQAYAAWVALALSTLALIVALCSYIQQWRANEIADKPVLYVMLKPIPAERIAEVAEARRVTVDPTGLRLDPLSRDEAEQYRGRSVFVRVQNVGRGPALSVQLTFTMEATIDERRVAGRTQVFFPSIGAEEDAWFEIQIPAQGSFLFMASRNASALNYRALKSKRMSIAANGMFIIRL